jgi:pimeloyl-ACP methyl ester carboxylesterase
VFIRGRAPEIIAVLEPWLLTENIISQLTQPALVFVHEQDQVTPPDEIDGMLAGTNAPVQVVLFEGIGHASGQFLRTADYSAHLDAFLRKVWKN